MKKLAVPSALLVITSFAATAGAAEHWRGAGWGGDGTSWSDVLNWDDMLPWDTSWDVNRSGEQGTPANHVINVDISGTTTVGRVYFQSGYKTAMTINSGVTFDTQRLEIDNNAASSLTIEPGAQWNIDAITGQMVIGRGTRVDVFGGLSTLDLRINDGYVVINVHGVAECGQIGKFSDDPGHEINVHSGGLLAIGAGGINWDNNPNRRIGVHKSGTVQLAGDRTGDYLDVITNLDAGTWVVDYSVTRTDYTTITLVTPCWDQDDDDDVDMTDFAALQRCLTIGAPGEGVGDGCQCYDVRSSGGQSGGDGEIDAWDLAAFDECASGPAVTADPGCLD